MNHLLQLFSSESSGVLNKTVAGHPVWHYLAVAVWILISFLAALVTGWILKRLTKRLAERTTAGLADQVHGIVRAPLRLAAVLVMLNLGVRVCGMSAGVVRLVDGVLVTAIAIAVLRALLRLVDLLHAHAGEKLFHGDAKLAAVMLPVLTKTLKVFIVVTGGLTAAQYLGLPVTSVIAGLGIGGIAVALAAQNTLANFFGSLVVLADRPFQIGDVVRIDPIEGKVETIGLRSTRIRTANGDLVTIPNKNIADSVVINRTPKN